MERTKMIYDLEKLLDAKQKLEVEIEQLEGKSENHIRSEEDSELIKNIYEMKQKLKDMDDDFQNMDSLNKILILKERRANAELEEAKSELIEGLREMTGSQSVIGVKQMGQLDQEVFVKACKLKGTKGDLEREAALLCLEWQNEIRKSEWHPFKHTIVDGKAKEVIMEDDEKLQALREEWGNEAYNAVTQALLECKEHNPCGMYPVPELWNFREDRKASVAEAVAYLVADMNNDMSTST